MTQPIKKIVILTSGGDSPGMNAAVRAVVRSCIHAGISVFGAENGYFGLVKKRLIPLNARSVANCIQRGGTILKTARCPAFRDQAVRAECGAFLKEQQVDALVVLGGDGSFRGAESLQAETGIAVIGIPCTIDNDIPNTDYCIGFDTARNTALQAIDKIRDTAFSLDRNFIIEVMGRSSGFLAVDVGIAGGAEFILTPEFPIDIDALSQKIKQQQGKKIASIIVVAESDRPGHSMQLAQAIYEKTGVEYKVCILGHTQRGGSPTVQDRLCASLMGALAVQSLLEGARHGMMAEQRGEYKVVPFPASKQSTRFYTNDEYLRLNEIICEMDMNE